MNPVPTLPDGDLRPAARDRQRDELIAIVEQESGPARRRRFLVPAAAAAAIALIAGAAVAVPALRRDSAPEPAAPPVPAGMTKVEPLNAAETKDLGEACRFGAPAGVRNPVVLDGLRVADPPTGVYAARWVVVRFAGQELACGFDAAGKRVSGLLSIRALTAAVDPGFTPDSGRYLPGVGRITVTPVGGQPVQAELRHGLYFAAVAYVRVRGPRTARTPRPWVVRGYDASGKLVYTSALTDGDIEANRGVCYVDPTGKTVITAWTDNPHPDPRTCRPTYAWRWLPN